jgi:WD40 repeat protein
VISGGADNAARMFDITNGQSQQVAQHDAPVKVVKWIETPQGGILATGSWDKTVKVSICDPLNACMCLITPVITIVLGYAIANSRCHRSTPRALLQHGRAISAHGSCHSRAPYPDFQSHKPKHSI